MRPGRGDRRGERPRVRAVGGRPVGPVEASCQYLWRRRSQILSPAAALRLHDRFAVDPSGASVQHGVVWRVEHAERVPKGVVEVWAATAVAVRMIGRDILHFRTMPNIVGDKKGGTIGRKKKGLVPLPDIKAKNKQATLKVAEGAQSADSKGRLA